jgi:hypothetical protein
VKVRNLVAYTLYYSRDHRGRLFDVRQATGSAGKALTGRMALRLGAWAAIMGFAIYLSLHAYRLATASGSPSLFSSMRMSVGFILFASAFSLFGMARELPRERRRRCEYLATRGRCGGCGYDLAEVAAEADGCRVCAECGTAWRS